MQATENQVLEARLEELSNGVITSRIAPVLLYGAKAYVEVNLNTAGQSEDRLHLVTPMCAAPFSVLAPTVYRRDKGDAVLDVAEDAREAFDAYLNVETLDAIAGANPAYDTSKSAEIVALLKDMRTHGPSF